MYLEQDEQNENQTKTQNKLNKKHKQIEIEKSSRHGVNCGDNLYFTKTNKDVQIQVNFCLSSGSLYAFCFAHIIFSFYLLFFSVLNMYDLFLSSHKVTTNVRLPLSIQ